VKTDGLCLSASGAKPSLQRRVGLFEKCVENSIRPKRRKFTEDFVTPAIVPDSAWVPIGEEAPHDGHLSVCRWTSVGLKVGKHFLNFGERESFEGAGAIRRFLRGGFDLHDVKLRALVACTWK